MPVSHIAHILNGCVNNISKSSCFVGRVNKVKCTGIRAQISHPTCHCARIMFFMRLLNSFDTIEYQRHDDAARVMFAKPTSSFHVPPNAHSSPVYILMRAEPYTPRNIKSAKEDVQCLSSNRSIKCSHCSVHAITQRKGTTMQ